MKTLFCLTLGLLAGVNAVAAPVLLNATDFAAALAPSTAVVETFNGFQEGFKSSPLQLANSTFTADSTPYVGAIDPLFSTYSLITQQALGSAFSGFGAGTTLFGLDLAGFIPADTLEVTVVDDEGASTFRATIASFGGFIGVMDVRGLISVGFKDLGYGSGQGNYAFDNVVTGSMAIPEPASLGLAGLGLLMMLAMASTGRVRP